MNAKEGLLTISPAVGYNGDKYVLTPLPTIQTLIKENRQRKKLTQVALAKKSRLTTAEISRIESGQTKKPSKKILRKLSPHIGISYEELLLVSGYSGTIEEHSYFTESDIPIPVNKIVKDIYLADSALLNELQDIHTLSPTDIDLLKTLIALMKSLSNTTKDNNSNSIIVNMFITIKNYLLEQINLISQLLSSSSLHVE